MGAMNRVSQLPQTTYPLTTAYCMVKSCYVSVSSIHRYIDRVTLSSDSDKRVSSYC